MLELSAAIFGYFLGSIPFGLVLAKLCGYGDIRKIGSGNIGATNVLRTGNKLLAFVVLLLDGGKGAFAVLPFSAITYASQEAAMMGHNASIIAGLFAVIGHMFPVWLKFKGGKGVATTFGMLLVLVPTVGVACCLIWLVTALLFRYSSLAALVSIFAAPPLAYFIYADPVLTGVCGIIAMLIWFKHRANIQRLVNGAEPKIGKKK